VSDEYLVRDISEFASKRTKELEKQLQRNKSYFSCICESLDIDHKSSLTEILVAIGKLTSNKGR
jgi:hypothetical protein